jgi:glycosyltransferase involved in cell wall biosynthesis
MGTANPIQVVDDGSSQPEALRYLEELELKFLAKGWYFARQENRGPGAARNHAAAQAKGKWLMFMDDDNYAKVHYDHTCLSFIHY